MSSLSNIYFYIQMSTSFQTQGLHMKIQLNETLEKDFQVSGYKIVSIHFYNRKASIFVQPDSIRLANLVWPR